MPAMTLQLHKTYRNSGFFNVRVGFDRYVARRNGMIEIFLDHDQNPIRGHSDRDINPNHTPRIFGNQSLRRYFQKFPLNAQLQVEFLSSTSIRILSPASGSATQASGTTAPSKPQSVEYRPAELRNRDVQPLGSCRSSLRTIEIVRYTFELVSAIQVARDKLGIPIEDFPQSRFNNSRNLPLNRHGAGPFCRLIIGVPPALAGVYAITSDAIVRYVGECTNLRQRFSAFGYGAIHPRNCFVGGQSTNCKLNHAILTETKANHTLDLWWLRTANRKAVEATIIRAIRPQWNAKIV